jgi:hypothetical protein
MNEHIHSDSNTLARRLRLKVSDILFNGFDLKTTEVTFFIDWVRFVFTIYDEQKVLKLLSLYLREDALK